MAAFQTFFRTVVMLATLGLLAKLWYHYGPTVDELKTISTRVSEVAQQAWADYWTTPPPGGALAHDPRLPTQNNAPAPFVPQDIPQLMPPTAQAGAPASFGTVQLAGGTPAEVVPLAAATPSSAWPASSPAPVRLPPNPTPAPSGSNDARLATLLDGLTKQGVRDPQLAAWGSRGELMRFSCNVPWANSPLYTQHFEAIAATPVAAVEQVAAEIAAWRGGQH